MTSDGTIIVLGPNQKYLVIPHKDVYQYHNYLIKYVKIYCITAINDYMKNIVVSV